MGLKVFLSYKNNQRRSAKVTRAFQRSLLADGNRLTSYVEKADLGIIYGMGPSHKEQYDYLRLKNKPVLIIDLGYWDRSVGLGGATKYKISVNYWHPCDYVMKLNCGHKKFDRANLDIQPWQKEGEHILLAGMGQKSYVLYDMPDMSWDIWAAKEIRKYTDRPIMYRPKPSWKNAPPIPDTAYAGGKYGLDGFMEKAYAVVTHHSNVSVDGLLKGIPSFTWDGAAKDMALQDLSKIETPYYPENRNQFFYNLAYCNWSIDEIANGECWRYLKRTFF